LVRAIYEGDIQITGQQLFVEIANDSWLVPAGSWSFRSDATPSSFWVNTGALLQPPYKVGTTVYLRLELQIKNNSGCGAPVYGLSSGSLETLVDISPTHPADIKSFTLRPVRMAPNGQSIVVSYADSPLAAALAVGAISITHAEVYLDGQLRGPFPAWIEWAYGYAQFNLTIADPEGKVNFGGRKVKVKFSILNNTRCGSKTYESESNEVTLPNKAAGGAQ
jgi:hypothetical protein